MSYQEGELIEVKLIIRLPKAASEDEVDEWLYFNLLQNGSLAHKNPLYNESVDDFGPYAFQWESTGMKGRKEDHDHTPNASGGVSYKTTYHRELITTK